MTINFPNLEQKLDNAAWNLDEVIRKFLEYLFAPAGDTTIEYYDPNGNKVTKTIPNRQKLVDMLISDVARAHNKVLYINSATGDDNNDGLTPDTPLKTPKGVAAKVPVLTRAIVVQTGDVEFTDDTTAYLDYRFIDWYLNGYQLIKRNTVGRFQFGSFAYFKLSPTVPLWLPETVRNMNPDGTPKAGKIVLDVSGVAEPNVYHSLFLLVDTAACVVIGDMDSELTIEANHHILTATRAFNLGGFIRCNVVPLGTVSTPKYVAYVWDGNEDNGASFTRNLTVSAPFIITNRKSYRERLIDEQTRRVYIHYTEGSDEHGDGSPERPWRTPQKAVREIPHDGRWEIELLSTAEWDPRNNAYVFGLVVAKKRITFRLNGHKFKIRGFYDPNRGRFLYHNFLLADGAVVLFDDLRNPASELILEPADQVSLVLDPSTGQVIEGVPPAGTTFGTAGLSAGFVSANHSRNTVILACRVRMGGQTGPLVVSGAGEWGGFTVLQLATATVTSADGLTTYERDLITDGSLVYNIQSGGRGYGYVYINNISLIKNSQGTPYNATVGDAMYFGNLIGGVKFDPNGYPLNLDGHPLPQI